MSILEGIGDGGSGGDLYVDSNRWYSEAAFVLITGMEVFYLVSFSFVKNKNGGYYGEV